MEGPALALALGAFRVANALSITTFFQADEYWQALEPAHKWVFGYGDLTWEWQRGLRSAVHPLLYTIPYYAARALDLNYTWVIAGPKILSGVLAAVGEYYLYRLVLVRTRDAQLARYTLLLSVCSVWNWMCWTRSFANSLELTLTTLGFFLLESGSPLSSLLVAAVTCVVRPTSGIVWAVAFAPLAWRKPTLVWAALAIGAAVVAADALVNRAFYSRWVFPLYEFFKFNVGSNLSAFYGVSRADFYVDQAIPILLLHYTPCFVWGVWMGGLCYDNLLMGLYLLVFTAIQHKEFRFIYPLMPFMLQASARGLLAFRARVPRAAFRAAVFGGLLLSVPLSFYLSRVHEAGEYKMPLAIRTHVLETHTQKPITVGFLTPCHSTPFQSHIHLPPQTAQLWYLTCLPPLEGGLETPLETYMDESDHFYADPVAFLQANFPPALDPSADCADFSHCWPHFLVMFETLWDNIPVRTLLEPNYIVVEALPNSLAHWDHRREGRMLLLEHFGSLD